MENLLGIHDRKQIKDLSKDDYNNSKSDSKKIVCKKIIKRATYRKNNENIIIVILFTVAAILFLISFYKSFQTYKSIISKYEATCDAIENNHL